MGNVVLPNQTIPYVSTYKSDYALWCLNYVQQYFKLRTPSGEEKGMGMIKDMLQSFKENFEW